MSCIFCDIINKKSPAKILYEDENFILIKDIKPDAMIHLLAIPKKHFDNFFSAESEDLNTIHKIHIYAAKNACKLGLEKGFRLLINNGEQASQTVFHCHVQILGGQQLRHPVSHIGYIPGENEYVFEQPLAVGVM